MQSKIEQSFRLFAEITWSFCAAPTAELGYASFCSCAASLTLCAFCWQRAPSVQGCWISCPVGHRLRDQLPNILTTTSLKQSAWYTETSVLRCGVRKPFLVQPFCLELSLAAVQKVLQEGEAPVDSSVSVQFFRYASLSESETPSPAPLLASKRPMSNPELSRTGRSHIMTSRALFCLIVDSFEDEGFRNCSDEPEEEGLNRLARLDCRFALDYNRKKRAWLVCPCRIPSFVPRFIVLCRTLQEWHTARWAIEEDEKCSYHRE